jgi:hypothetical protein
MLAAADVELRIRNNVNAQYHHQFNFSGGLRPLHSLNSLGRPRGRQKTHTPERFRAFAQRRRLTLPLAFDPGGKTHDSFGLTGVPALVIIDRSGRVRFVREGYNPAETSFRHDMVEFVKTL